MQRERTRRSELTVDELNTYIQGLFNSDLLLKALVISGEIAEFKRTVTSPCWGRIRGYPAPCSGETPICSRSGPATGTRC